MHTPFGSMGTMSLLYSSAIDGGPNVSENFPSPQHYQCQETQQQLQDDLAAAAAAATKSFLLQSSPGGRAGIVNGHLSVRKALDFDTCRDDIQRAALAKLLGGNNTSIKQCLLGAGFCDAQANNRTMQMRVRRHLQKLQQQSQGQDRKQPLPSASRKAIKRSKSSRRKDFVPPATIAFVCRERLKQQRFEIGQNGLTTQEGPEGDCWDIFEDDEVSVLTEVSDMWDGASSSATTTTSAAAVMASVPLEIGTMPIRVPGSTFMVGPAAPTSLLRPPAIAHHNGIIQQLAPPPPVTSRPPHYIPNTVSPLPSPDPTAMAAAAAASAIYGRDPLQVIPTSSAKPLFANSLMNHPSFKGQTAAAVAASSLFNSHHLHQDLSYQLQQQSSIFPTPFSF